MATNGRMNFYTIPIREIIRVLEGQAGNTDTDPRWRAATELRRLEGWESGDFKFYITEQAEE